MMADNFGQNIVISMKSTNMPVSILPKTKGVLKMLTKGKKQKGKINHFRKTACIYHRFLSFNSK